MLMPVTLLPDQPLQQQLFDQLSGLIVSSRLRPGTRMPSSRMLADQFSISRTTVLLTYERLIAEGYLQTTPAKGTFVASRPARPAREPWPPRLFECPGHAGAAADAQRRVCPKPARAGDVLVRDSRLRKESRDDGAARPPVGVRGLVRGFDHLRKYPIALSDMLLSHSYQSFLCN